MPDDLRRLLEEVPRDYNWLVRSDRPNPGYFANISRVGHLSVANEPPPPGVSFKTFGAPSPEVAVRSSLWNCLAHHQMLPSGGTGEDPRARRDGELNHRAGAFVDRLASLVHEFGYLGREELLANMRLMASRLEAGSPVGPLVPRRP